MLPIVRTSCAIAAMWVVLACQQPAENTPKVAAQNQTEELSTLAKNLHNAMLSRQAAPSGTYARALKLAQVLGDTSQLLIIQNAQMNLLAMQGKLDSAVALYHSIEATTSTNHELDSLKANAAYNAARIYLQLGQTQRAEELCKVALAEFRMPHHAKQRVRIYNLAGLVYGSTGRVSTTLSYFERARQEAISNNLVMDLQHVYNNMAIAYSNKNAADTAVAYIDSAITLHNELVRDSAELASLYHTKSEVFENLGQIARAKLWLEKSNALHQQLGQPDAELLHTTRRSAARLEMKMGNHAQAEKLLSTLLKEADSTGNLLAQRELTAHLATATQAQGQLARALAYSQRSAALADSLGQAQRLRLDEEFAQRFQLATKDLELRNTQLQAEVQARRLARNQLVLAAMALLLLLLLGAAAGALLLVRKLRQANAALKEQQTLVQRQNANLSTLNRSKDKLISIIAHDLKGPLGTMSYYPPMLLEMIEEGDLKGAREHIALLQQSMSQTYDLLENLLKWAVERKDRVSTVGRVMVVDVLQSVYDLCSPAGELKGVRLARTDHRKDMVVLADRYELFTILRNLVFNALKFTPVGGLVTMHAEQENDTVVLWVRDTGVGMSQEIQQRLFTEVARHTTTGTSGEQGTGLGLLLVRELVERNRGTMQVNSQLGAGSTIIIRLPSAQAERHVGFSLAGIDSEG